MDCFAHLGLKVFFGAEHRAPGGVATGAVGKGADDPLPQPVAIAQRLAVTKDSRRRAAAAQGLLRLVEAREAIDTPLVGAAANPAPSVAPLLELEHANAQIGHGGLGHGLNQGAQGVIGRQAGRIDAAAAAG